MNTISAISTPPGVGAIGIVRISGPDTMSILMQIFKPANSKQTLIHKKAALGWIYDNENVIDQVLITYFKGPNSYTGEDLAEISCHGGQFILSRVLRAVLDRGAHMAGPGQFTERAFLNGKMDLLQAEAVEDLIMADSELSLKAAHQLLEGELSKKVNEMKSQMIQLISNFEAEIEFPDEGDIQDNMNKILSSRLQLINDLINFITNLCDSFEQGMRIKEGFSVALLGAPNTGKSTLLNALVGYERALVSNEAGTTRDYIREKLYIHGYPLTVIDMAGVRDGGSILEQEGINKGSAILTKASAIIILLDASRDLSEDDKKAISNCPKDTPKIWVLNKTDQKITLNISHPLISDKPFIHISALKNKGLSEIKKAIENLLEFARKTDEQALHLTHARHQDSLLKCNAFLKQGLFALQQKDELEIVVYELKNALNELEVLTGKITADDIMNNIFKNFCIGK